MARGDGTTRIRSLFPALAAHFIFYTSPTTIFVFQASMEVLIAISHVFA